MGERDGGEEREAQKEKQKRLNNALRTAAQTGADKEARRLLTAGADARDIVSGLTALLFAVNYGKQETIEALVGVSDLEAKTVRDGETVLMHAARLGRAQALRTLLGAGADPLARDDNGMTALSLAAEKGLTECVAILASVSDLDARDRWGMTAEGRALAGNWEESAKEIAKERQHRERDVLLDEANEAATKAAEGAGGASAPRRGPLAL
jgi:ankyrin repeat protein